MRLFLFTGAFLFLPWLANSEGGLNLGWNANPESNIAGYSIYYGTNSFTYTNKVNAGNQTNFLLRGLNSDTLYFLNLTAVNSNGIESDFTTELFAVPSELPVAIVTVDFSTNLIQWSHIVSLTNAVAALPGYWRTTIIVTNLDTP